jgi:GTP-binding protein HflX
MTGHGVAMSRLGGGIGTRGPGETKLETDRRRIHQRIQAIEKIWIVYVAGEPRSAASASLFLSPTLALVGYTNAGKSTLFNRLTGAEFWPTQKCSPRSIPRLRHHCLPSKRQVLVSDTVGFIRSLPTTLVRAFRATLEEVSKPSCCYTWWTRVRPPRAEHTAHVLATWAKSARRRLPRSGVE